MLSTTWMKSTEGRRVLPISFQPPLIRALLRTETPKRRTRRLLSARGFESWTGIRDDDGWPLSWTTRNGHRYRDRMPCRYGEPGAVLYVQEALVPVDGRTVYASTGHLVLDERGEPVPWTWQVNQLAPRYCRKALTRLRLEVTRIWGEHLQQITEEEAVLEGVEPTYMDPFGEGTEFWTCYAKSCEREGGCAGVLEARTSFSTLWDSIHTADGERWADDPGVFVVAFDEWDRRMTGEQVTHPMG